MAASPDYSQSRSRLRKKSGRGHELRQNSCEFCYSTAGDFTASIDWGDGGTSAGGITANTSGGFDIAGGHTYAKAGNHVINVDVNDQDGSTATATGSALVAPSTSAASLNGAGLAVQGYELSPLAGAALATFTVVNSQAAAGDFAATVDWGDGGTSAGAVSSANGTFTVAGSHTYGDERIYAVSIWVVGAGLSANIATQATIGEQLLPDGTRGTANQRYVDEIYRDALHREAEPSGRAFWTARLDAGETHAQLAFEMVRLAFPRESQRNEVHALYETYLQREPEPGGLEFWTAFLYDDGTDEQMAEILASSDEYRRTRGGGTNDGFLGAIFQDGLHRAIDAPSRASFDAAMAKGATRADVAAIVFGSDEFRRTAVSGWYGQFLDRPVALEGLDSLVAQLAAGQRDEQIIAELVASDEFFAKTAG